jgi:hypothetical protein
MQVALSLAEVQLLTGKAGPARIALDILQMEASQRGYLSISRKASAMAASLETTAKSRSTDKN